MESQHAVDKVFFVGDIHSHKTFGRRTLTCIACRSCKVGQYICLSLTVFYNITALFQLVICICKSRLVGCGIIVQFRFVEFFRQREQYIIFRFVAIVVVSRQPNSHVPLFFCFQCFCERDGRLTVRRKIFIQSNIQFFGTHTVSVIIIIPALFEIHILAFKDVADIGIIPDCTTVGGKALRHDLLRHIACKILFIAVCANDQIDRAVIVFLSRNRRIMNASDLRYLVDIMYRFRNGFTLCVFDFFSVDSRKSVELYRKLTVLFVRIRDRV